MRLSGTKATAIHQYRGLGNQLWDLAGNRPSLDLRFAESKSLVDATTGSNLVDFTRASSGTYVGSDGLIKTATTNLLLRSEEFDQSPWGQINATVVANQATAPDGTPSADQIFETTPGVLRVSQAVTVASGTTYTASIFLKAGSNSRVFWREDNEDLLGVQVDLATGSIVSGSGAITPVGNGWYRVSFTGSVVGTLFEPEIRVVNAPGTLFAWGAQLEQSSTVGEYIPTTSTINSAPRFDHDPVTGESLGLLVEESRTNSIRNNTMVGAVAGTPGTAPTNWNFSSLVSGLSSEIVEIGSEDNINYLDIKISGTPSSSSFLDIQPEPVNQVAASNGQAWTHSSYIKLQNGATTNASISIFVFGRDNLGNFIANELAEYGLTPTSAPLKQQRQTVTYTASSASVAYVQPRIRITFSAGAAIDITLRIGLPQLEQGAFATSVIPTEGSTVTRAADVASISGSNFSSWYRQDEGTVFTEFLPRADATAGVVYLNNGSVNEATRIFYNSSISSYTLSVRAAGSEQSSINNLGAYVLQSEQISAAYKVNDLAASRNGGASISDTSATLPTGIDRLELGTNQAANYLNGTISRLTYWPTRLPNKTLQTITQ